MKTQPVRLSGSGFCAEAYYCYKLYTTKSAKQEFIRKHDLYISDMGFVYTPVTLNNGQAGTYWMQCITGTLFDLFGTNAEYGRINVRSLKLDNKAGAAILLSKNMYSNYQIRNIA